jgi:hypothetical protein
VRYADVDTTLTVHNVKTGKARKVNIRPHRGWGGVGLLGLVAR